MAFLEEINKILEEKEKKEDKYKQEPSPIFSAKSKKITDKKDHFPINTVARARNALARVNQFSEVPDWYDGSLKELVNAVVSAVKKKYPSIEVSKAASKPGKD
jgi:hypothetical protein